MPVLGGKKERRQLLGQAPECDQKSASIGRTGSRKAEMPGLPVRERPVHVIEPRRSRGASL